MTHNIFIHEQKQLTNTPVVPQLEPERPKPACAPKNKQNKPEPPKENEEAIQQQLTLQQVSVLEQKAKKKRKGQGSKKKRNTKDNKVPKSGKKKGRAPKKAKPKKNNDDEVDSEYEEDKTGKTKNTRTIAKKGATENIHEEDQGDTQQNTTTKKNRAKNNQTKGTKRVFKAQVTEEEEGKRQAKKPRQGKKTMGREMFMMTLSSIHCLKSNILKMRQQNASTNETRTNRNLRT